MKKYYFLLLVMTLSFFGCEDEDRNRKFMSFDDMVIYDYLSESKDFSEWSKLIDCAGMKETFRLSTTPMTCFVVKNESLLKYVKSKYNLDRVEDLDQEAARLLVKYHTLPNVTLALTTFRNGKLADSTATGDYLACLLSVDGGAIYLNRDSKIVDYDKEMVNGVIHVLDEVIDPIVNTLGDYLEANQERYSLMNALLAACPDSTKALFSQIQDDRVPGMKCRRTLFVVPDEVYQAAGITDLEQLKAAAGVTDDVTLDQYVRYHMLRKELYGKDIIERLEFSSVTKDKVEHALVDAKGITLETMAAGKLLVANSGALDIIFNEDMDGGLKFNGALYNIPLKNGVLHELNGVLKIADPSSMITLLDPTDYINFQRISSYRSEGMPKTQTLFKAEDYAPYIKWESTPDAKADAIGYIVFTTGTYNFKGNGFLYGDCLYVSTGPVGYVEYVTPPVPKGRYAVCPFYKTTKNAAGGKYKLSIDGETVGTEISGYTPGGDSFLIPSLGIVNFKETQSHTVRLTVGSRQGEILLDMIILEPVK